MALNVYFSEDVRAAVLGVTVAALGAAVATGTPDTSYCAGVLDTARALALVHQVDWADLAAEVRANLADLGALDVLGMGLLEATP